jgi:hypothetical protein
VSRLIPWGVAGSFPVVLPALVGSDFQSNPTLATGDFKISKDGGAWANLATLPTVSPASSVQVIVTLSAAEAEFTTAVVAAIDTATKEWKDNAWPLHTPRAEGAVCGKITSGTPTTGSFISAQLTQSGTDLFGGGTSGDAFVTFLTGVNAGGTRKITGFTPGTDTLAFEAFPAAPSVSDVFIIVNGA